MKTGFQIDLKWVEAGGLDPWRVISLPRSGSRQVE